MNFDIFDSHLFNAITARFATLPSPVSGGFIVALFVGGALLLHALLYRVLLSRVERRYGLTALLLHKSRKPLRLAFVLCGLILALPHTELDTSVESPIRHIMLIMLISLIGWTLIVLTNHFTERSSRRYPIDVEDNLRARKHITQIRVLKRATNIIIGLVTFAAVLMTFESVREYGVSLFASAGAAGLVLGIAARPVLANLIAGIQIAITQPIRLEDVVVIEGEWGWIEEIFATYVIVRLWDRRRLVVPLSYFIEQPFQNWTRQSAQVIGAVVWFLDYTAPVEAMREKLEEFLKESDLWDKDVANLQVVDTTADTIAIRALMTARTSPKVWDLRCEIREKMLLWLRNEHPQSLPRTRGELHVQTDLKEQS